MPAVSSPTRSGNLKGEIREFALDGGFAHAQTPEVASLLNHARAIARDTVAQPTGSALTHRAVRQPGTAA